MQIGGLLAALGQNLKNGLNVAAAAESLLLHPNTLRYRLRSISELFGLSLDEPDGRLAAWMFLRLGQGRTTPPIPFTETGPAWQDPSVIAC